MRESKTAFFIFSPKEHGLRQVQIIGHLTAVSGCEEDGARLFSGMPSARIRGKIY